MASTRAVRATPVVEERANVQHLIARDAKLGFEFGLHWNRIANVAKHQAVRHSGGCQRDTCLFERFSVEIDAAHCEWILLEMSSTQRAVEHIQIDSL